jgi:hypothetical protein
MAAEGPTYTTEGVTPDTAFDVVESASPAAEAPQQRLREFYGAAYDSLGMGV